ncbi:MFS transporter [Kitasatospora fiedleri]|uniref:MFS transporter n=1 Tax=Kitasatospora fiedleri TaxID=2991545 RepID=UPI00249C50C2|nr:MFS transporter [Kitasatospora fiedleri]
MVDRRHAGAGFAFEWVEVPSVGRHGNQHCRYRYRCRRAARAYLWWLTGTRVSAVGDAALATALGWAGAGYGGSAAGLVLAAVTVPRTVLLLLGGAVVDRYGPRRVALLADAAMVVVVLALAVVDRTAGGGRWTLIGFVLLIGTVDAFQLPASGALPRLLVVPAQLSRALALRQAGGQVAVLLGAPVGALLVGGVGLAGAAVADAVTFLAVLAVTLRLRAGEESGRSGGGLVAGLADGLRVVRRDRTLRVALPVAAVAAAGVLPVVGLLGPLLVRAHAWGAGAVGLSAGGQALGVLGVSLAAARYGVLRRAGCGVVLGLGIAALGTAALALAPAPAWAGAAAVLVGAGSSVFACHLGPLVLAGAPATHLGRVQALLALVQSATLTAANPIWGALAGAVGVRAALLGCAALTGAVAVAVATTRALREPKGLPIVAS